MHDLNVFIGAINMFAYSVGMMVLNVVFAIRVYRECDQKEVNWFFGYAASAIILLLMQFARSINHSGPMLPSTNLLSIVLVIITIYTVSRLMEVILRTVGDDKWMQRSVIIMVFPAWVVYKIEQKIRSNNELKKQQLQQQSATMNASPVDTDPEVSEEVETKEVETTSDDK